MAYEDQEKDDGCFFPREFLTKVCAVRFPGAEGRNPALVDPSNGGVHEIATAAIIDGMRGKRCVACHGSWFLVLDEATRECFLTTLFVASPSSEGEAGTTTVVPLPPMPADPPHLELLFNCALSAPTPTAPGCIVLLGLIGERFLRYCRPGDEAWSRVEVKLDDEVDTFDGAVVFHGGRIYATTGNSYAVVLDASSPAPAAPRVERTDVTIPAPFPINQCMRQHLVATTSPNGGDLYFVRAYLFGFPAEVFGVDVCRWDPSEAVWRDVDSIGDTTLFVGSNCFAVSPATEAGTEPDCIHVLRSCYDGVRVYTISLHDMTIRCNWVRIDDDDDDEDDKDDTVHDDNDDDDTAQPQPPPDTKVYWSVPSGCRLKLEPPRQEDDQHEKNIACPDPGQGSECMPRWSSLPTDLLAGHVVPKLSFIDFLHLKSVCKDWSGISTPIQDTESCPLLMTPRRAQPGSIDGSSLDVFDLVAKKKYSLSVRVPRVTVQDDSTSLMLHCSKNGWVVVSRGHYSFFLVNPFKRGDDAVVVLPPVRDLFWLKGISFCSKPGSPDFMVVIVEHHSFSGGDTVMVRTWREGQDSWQRQEFDCEDRFVMATHSPLFLDGEFYCLARDGKLGTFDPNTMAWRVLDDLEPIHGEGYVSGDEGDYAYLVEWKGEVVAIFRYKDVEDPVEVFLLYRSQMAWSKVEELEDGAMFWDRKQAVATPSWSLAQGFSCNKVYQPSFTGTSGGVAECVFYSFMTKEYSSCSNGLKEPINAIWFGPDLDAYQ